MANKNTKVLRKRIASASRKGERSVLHDKPVYNWHSNPKKEFITQEFPTATVGGDNVVSGNRKKNLVMRVYRNKDQNGKCDSLTCHEPALKGEFIRPRNHQYLTYRQPRVDRSRPVAA